VELATFRGCCVLVTHEPQEALGLTSRLVVLEAGRVVQSGTPEEVAARPRTPYVADLVGVNLLPGLGQGGHVVLASGALVSVRGGAEGPVLALIHPRAVGLYRDRPHGSPRNVWPATVGDIDPEGELVRVRLTGAVPLVAELTAAARDELGLAPGADVWASVKATEVAVYPL
jgi:molybdate transport system ATP-binding protein